MINHYIIVNKIKQFSYFCEPFLWKNVFWWIFSHVFEKNSDVIQQRAHCHIFLFYGQCTDSFVLGYFIYLGFIIHNITTPTLPHTYIRTYIHNSFLKDIFCIFDSKHFKNLGYLLYTTTYSFGNLQLWSSLCV